MKYDRAPSEGNKTEWDQWGTRSYTVMPHVSPSSKRIAEAYRLRPSDVVVLSFPKTGTTWTQTVCEQLRTNAEGYDGFDDITERQPWLEFAHDCGQDLDDETYGKSILLLQEEEGEEPKLATVDTKGEGSDESQPPSSLLSTRGPLLTPRIFKSHQLLSAINPGGKYLCIVRDPAATLLSWFDFQKAKGRPGYAEYEDANEYIADRSELFSGNHIFGTNLWEVSVAPCRNVFASCISICCALVWIPIPIEDQWCCRYSNSNLNFHIYYLIFNIGSDISIHTTIRCTQKSGRREMIRPSKLSSTRVSLLTLLTGTWTISQSSTIFSA